MTTLNTPSANESLPRYAMTLQTLEPNTLPSNTAGHAIHWFGRAAAPIGTVGPVGTQVYRMRAAAAEPETQSPDAFDELVAEAEADPAQAESLAAGRQWVAQAFYQDEHRTLAGLRLAAGLSQRQLGERCGLGQQHISRYESGKHQPSLDTAHEMARALAVDLDTYFTAWQATVATAAAVPKP